MTMLCHHAECCSILIVILDVVLLGVIMLSVVMMSVIMLNVVMLGVVTLSVVVPFLPSFSHSWGQCYETFLSVIYGFS
jgi:hypothetical protein